MASGRPILCIGPTNGDTAKILDETQAGVTIGFEDKEKMKETIKSLYLKHQGNSLPDNDTVSIGKYSRRALTAGYVNLLGIFQQQ
jgi:hypothetical protein